MLSIISSATERVKMLEIENQQMKTIKEQRETELLRQIRHLQDDKEQNLMVKRFPIFLIK